MQGRLIDFYKQLYINKFRDGELVKSDEKIQYRKSRSIKFQIVVSLITPEQEAYSRKFTRIMLRCIRTRWILNAISETHDINIFLNRRVKLNEEKEDRATQLEIWVNYSEKVKMALREKQMRREFMRLEPSAFHRIEGNSAENSMRECLMNRK